MEWEVGVSQKATSAKYLRKKTLYVQSRGESSERSELCKLCGESTETRQTTETQIIRNPWKYFWEKEWYETCRNLRVQHCQLVFFEHRQVIICLKGRKEDCARFSFWKKLSWILTSGSLLWNPSGVPWV